MSTKNTQQPSSVETEKAQPGSLHPAGYTPIYICFFADEDLPIGWVRTAEEAVEWANRVHCGYQHGAVKIVKSFEIKRERV